MKFIITGSDANLSQRQGEELTKLQGVPLNQQVIRRRLLIRSLRRAGHRLFAIAKMLRISIEQLQDIINNDPNPDD